MPEHRSMHLARSATLLQGHLVVLLSLPMSKHAPDEVVAAVSGMIKKVVDVLLIHENSLDVQKNVCHLFWVVAFLNDEMEITRWSLHGITKVFEAMTRFKEDKELNLVGCGMLLSMVEDEDSAGLFPLDELAQCPEVSNQSSSLCGGTCILINIPFALLTMPQQNNSL